MAGLHVLVGYVFMLFSFGLVVAVSARGLWIRFVSHQEGDVYRYCCHEFGGGSDTYDFVEYVEQLRDGKVVKRYTTRWSAVRWFPLEEGGLRQNSFKGTRQRGCWQECQHPLFTLFLARIFWYTQYMKLPRYSQQDINGRQVLLRCDVDVQVNAEGMVDEHHDLRLERIVPTVRELLTYGAAQIVLIGHRGRPEGRDELLSLEPIKDRLSVLLRIDGIHEDVTFVSDVEEDPSSCADARMVMLENLRFWPGEKKGDADFARILERWGAVYVNDAFGVSHRSDASIAVLPTIAESSFAGPELSKEVETLSSALNDLQHPFVVMFGGAKISTKLPLIERMLETADAVLLGGGIANTVLAARGVEVGASLIEKNMLAQAAELSSTKIVLPTDVVIADGSVKEIATLGKQDAILDIGPATTQLFAKSLASAKTILWNGPLGKFEDTRYAQSTYALARVIAEHHAAKTIAGGGETVEALEQLDLVSDIDFVSTGGGAMLVLLAGESLPGINALT